MNWHKIIDQRNLEMDRVIVRILRKTPEQLQIVREKLVLRISDPDCNDRRKTCYREWLEIVDQGHEAVCKVLLDESGRGDQLRQNSPFAMLMPQNERQQILKKYEALRPRAHPAGV